MRTGLDDVEQAVVATGLDHFTKLSGRKSVWPWKRYNVTTCIKAAETGRP